MQAYSKHERSLFFEIVCKVYVELPQKCQRIKENATNLNAPPSVSEMDNISRVENEAHVAQSRGRRRRCERRRDALEWPALKGDVLERRNHDPPFQRKQPI